MLLCCGEALIDMIPAPTVSGQDGYVPHVGGAVFNTAIALGRLGVQTGMLTGLSTDLFGQQLIASLRANHVDTSLLVTSDRLTTLYFGGISLVFEPGAETYAALLKREAAARVVMLDPNIRPSFIRDIRRHRDRLDRMIAMSDIVKVSDEDLNWIYPGPQSLFEKLDFVRQAGPSVVILTRSDSGATAFLKDGTRVSVPVDRVDVVDTIGAGDTFNRGVLAKLAELGLLIKESLAAIDPDLMREALRFGTQVAGITVSRAGANPPWRHEL